MENLKNQTNQIWR